MVSELSPEGAVNIIGVGQSRSRGVRKGEIAEATAVEEDVRNAIVEAEQMADVEIRSVCLGVTGGHLRGFNNRGVHPVVSADREIAADDVEDVIKNAKAINLPAENHVIHAIRQHFLVDGQDDIRDPVRLLGARLEVEIHVIHGKLNRLQNPIRVVKGLPGLRSGNRLQRLGFFTRVARQRTERTRRARHRSGCRTTEFAVYAGMGSLKYTGVLAVGGDHVSNDLRNMVSKVPLGRAEQLKLEHGCAVLDESVKGRTIALTRDLGLPEVGQPATSASYHVSSKLGRCFNLSSENSPGSACYITFARAFSSAAVALALREFKNSRKMCSRCLGVPGEGKFLQRPEVRLGSA